VHCRGDEVSREDQEIEEKEHCEYQRPGK
jgi:hypothetical protein